MLDLNDLRLFVHIVEHRGILKAGRALGLPKSTISRRLAGLEDHLKARLIIRSGEEFRLTAAGEEVYRIGRAVIDAAREAEKSLLQSETGLSGRVSISASRLLAPCLSLFARTMRASHPDIVLVLEQADRPLDQNGDSFDLHLCAHHWSLRDTALIQRRICRSAMRFFAHPKLDVNIAAVTAGDIPVLAFGVDAAPEHYELTGMDGSTRMLNSGPALVSSDAAILAALALAEDGVALIPDYAARTLLEEGSLAHVLADWAGPATMITLLSPPRRLMNRSLRQAADTLGAIAKSEIIAPVQQVLETGRPVPNSRPADFIQVSSGASSHAGRALQDSQRLRPVPNPAQSEMNMNPMQKVLGAAALGAASLAAPASAQDAPGPLVLYTNDFEGVITDLFEADTGREIDVVQMSGGEILARIAAEASNPQWDVLIFNGSYSFHSLDQQGQLLRDVTPDNLDNLNDLGRSYLTENRSWFPIGLAASCLMLYRTDLVDTPPSQFSDLADPRFNGMFGMADPAVAAPAYPCVAQFFESMGMEAAEDLFTSYFDNGMRVFRTNGPTGQALVSGDIALALITSQVAYSLKASGEAPVEIVWPEAGAPGVVRGVGIQANSARPEAGKAFVEWLLEADTQSYLAQAVPSDGLFEPTVTGAVRRADGPAEGLNYLVASDAFAVENEAQIKTWFADRALN